MARTALLFLLCIRYLLPSLSFNSFTPVTRKRFEIYSKSPEKPKSSKFDRVIDDFVGKRFGAGEAWYGKQKSTMSDEEASEIENQRRPKLIVKDEDLKKNAVLLFGDYSSLDAIGDWIAFDLSAKGFNIRVASFDLTKSIQLFGLPGNNVDILTLSATSDEDSFLRAIKDVQAVVFVGNFNPSLFDSSQGDDYVTSVGKMMRCIMKNNGKTSGDSEIDVKKVVLVSRCLGSDSPQSNSIRPPTPFETISAVFNSFLNDDPLPISLRVFDEFRRKHQGVEALVRDSGIEYSIVRAPERVIQSRVGAKYPLVCSQSSSRSRLHRDFGFSRSCCQCSDPRFRWNHFHTRRRGRNIIVVKRARAQR
jgi:hypothetical protein